jgi:hypothetical protein
MATYRYRRGSTSFWFPILASHSRESIEARRATGWFCPDCGMRVATLFKEVKIVVYIIGVILLAASWLIFASSLLTGIDVILPGITESGEYVWVPIPLSIIMLVTAITLSVVIVYITLRHVILAILKRIDKKALEKKKDMPREYWDEYARRSKMR